MNYRLIIELLSLCHNNAIQTVKSGETVSGTQASIQAETLTKKKKNFDKKKAFPMM